jgi:hypothetical protein
MSVSQAMAQAKVALVEDLQKWLNVYVSENGIFSLFDFSLFDLAFLHSKVTLTSLGSFSNH